MGFIYWARGLWRAHWRLCLLVLSSSSPWSPLLALPEALIANARSGVEGKETKPGAWSERLSGRSAC
jgi:hypothetical protein